MPNKCSIVNCKGNYNEANKCRVFKLPKDETERQTWLNVIPPRQNFTIEPSKFFICEKHWPENAPTIKIPGGSTRPVCPPSIFNVPSSCLPSPKPAPRQPKSEDQQLKYFIMKDKIQSLSDFQPEKELERKYNNLIISRSDDQFVCVFMTEGFKESNISIIVHNKPTLCSPLTLFAYKKGISVPLGKILNPNNGLSSYSQFYEAVNSVLNYTIHIDDIIDKVVTVLKEQDLDSLKADKEKKLKFVTRQLQLLSHKVFSVSDYCLAIECFPTCHYDQLRDLLVLPGKTKVKSLVSGTDVNVVLDKTFNKVNDLQRNALLIVDEMKIRPTIAFSGGVLSGMAKNEPNFKATSMLCVMLKCLHGGPSVMISITPVHKLTSLFQFDIVIKAALMVEKSGGIVLGSVTDNHKINQQYCKLFNKIDNCQAKHPLDDSRVWYLLFDSVHILKCIRNNWLTENSKKLSIDNTTVGSFSDIKQLYKDEEDNILKSTPLTLAAVSPSRLQLQNVQHVLSIFNEKVVAALKLKGAPETAAFVQDILNWWNTVNVSGKGQDVRMNDQHRSVQSKESTSLQIFLEKFKVTHSGHGANRVQCLTHDTKKAIVQTTEAMIAISNHLLSNGFEYVLLRELQSDRIEGEFGVYRQSTGANAFMIAGDVVAAFKKRLARFSATFLQSLELEGSSENSHTCHGPISMEDALCIEKCLNAVTLSNSEEIASAYVAGWLQMKCGKELDFSEDETILTGEVTDFIEEVSRGGLTVPHSCTYELVRAGLCFLKNSRARACCRPRLMDILSVMDNYFDFGLSSKHLFRRLANVLLHGIQNLERDQEKNASSIKRLSKKQD